MYYTLEYYRNLILYPFFSESRNFVRNYKNINFKLFMVYTVKNEEDIIENNIRFHKAMGVDGFIVTSHNSDDGTNKILEKLKKEGLILEIIYETSDKFNQAQFCDRMIKLAKNKYKADWIISADADEIYCPNLSWEQGITYNLKECIAKYNPSNVNVLLLTPITFFPDGRDEYFNCPYFLIYNNNLNIENYEMNRFINSFAIECKKVIFKAKDYKKISIGNHSVKMRHKIVLPCANIKYFHYHIKNYADFVKRAERWLPCAQTMPKNTCWQEKLYVNLYEDGNLKEHYNSLFNEDTREYLIKEGAVIIDRSVSNIMKHLGLLK